MKKRLDILIKRDNKGRFAKGGTSWTKIHGNPVVRGNNNPMKKGENKRRVSRAMMGNKNNLGKKLSEETRKKISQVHKGKRLAREHRQKLGKAKIGTKGDKSNAWKGGLTPINKRIRNSIKFCKWRQKVFKRDNYTYWICEDRSGKGRKVILNSHHLKNFSEHPKLRFVISNGLTLCGFCHKTYTRFGE